MQPTLNPPYLGYRHLLKHHVPYHHQILHTRMTFTEDNTKL